MNRAQRGELATGLLNALDRVRIVDGTSIKPYSVFLMESPHARYAYRRLSITDLAEGMPVVARRDIERFGAYRCDGRVSAGSLGTVVSVRFADGTAVVEFADAETGERVRGDCDSTDLGRPVETPVRRDESEFATGAC
jgi:hypothetical protein